VEEIEVEAWPLKMSFGYELPVDTGSFCYKQPGLSAYL
jgi:hypothetical protein